MGKAFKCDRCSKYFDGLAPRIIESTTQNQHCTFESSKIYAICHECAEKFDKFIKGYELFNEIPGPKLNKGGY